jgi:hypothetical protein
VDVPGLPFVNGYPGPGTAEALFDELDYQRAVQAYIWGVPLVNGVALQRALEAAGVSLSEPSLLVFDHVLTPKQVIMTANSEVAYGMSVIDLGVTGPVVVDAPDGLFGVVIDLWNRGLVDIGIGPSHGQRIVLVPPGHDGDVPTDGYVVTPRTRRVFPIARGIVATTPMLLKAPDAFARLSDDEVRETEAYTLGVRTSTLGRDVETIPPRRTRGC